MLAETKRALRITADAYDAEIARLIKAGAADVSTVLAEPVDGISFSVSAQGVVTDNCTITDDEVIQAIITYVRCNFGSPEDYDRVKAAYDEMKAQLQSKSGYGLPEDEDAEV